MALEVKANLWPLPIEDETAIREHHLTADEGYERCVICRLLATIDSLRESTGNLVSVRRGTGGVFPDGTTNHSPIDFAATPVESVAETP